MSMQEIVKNKNGITDAVQKSRKSGRRRSRLIDGTPKAKNP